MSDEVASAALRVRQDRPGLAALLDYSRADDTVVVTALDRLGRSLSSVIRTAETLTEAGVLLRSLREGIDYATPTGRMLAGIFAALAGYERDLMHERAATGRHAARLRGRHTGRPPRLTAAQTRQIRALRDGGESINELAHSYLSLPSDGVPGAGPARVAGQAGRRSGLGRRPPGSAPEPSHTTPLHRNRARTSLPEDDTRPRAGPTPRRRRRLMSLPRGSFLCCGTDGCGRSLRTFRSAHEDHVGPQAGAAQQSAVPVTDRCLRIGFLHRLLDSFATVVQPGRRTISAR
ncbi:MAG: recombinase family protein [Mycobacteriales bacterium]